MSEDCINVDLKYIPDVKWINVAEMVSGGEAGWRCCACGLHNNKAISWAVHCLLKEYFERGS
jgi:hypothetical protein